MDKNKWISRKIQTLTKEGGRSHDQIVAIALSMANEKYQEGGAFGAVSNEQEFKNSIAPQRPIFKIQPVSTDGTRDGGRLPAGNYQKIYYKDPNQARIENQDYEYLNSSGFEELQKMNNYRLYLENLNKNNPQPNTSLAIRQQGGNYYNNVAPYFSTSQQNPTQDFNYPTYVPPQPPNQGIAIDPNNLTQETNIPSAEMQARMAQNKVDNTYSNNYDENGNAVDQNQEFNDYTRYNILNPFGGTMGLDGSLAYTGKAFGEGNTEQGILGAGLSALKGARGFLSAYAAGKANKNLEVDRKDKLYNTPPTYQYGQEGGKVTNADLLTNTVITNTPNPNVNIEKNEQVKEGDTGIVKKAVGDKHIDGGIDVNLSDNSKILSDYTKIGAENAKRFEKLYDVKLHASDTFAKVMDKVNKKIGIVKLVDEEKEYLTKIENTLKVKDQNTQKINLEFLSKEIQDIQAKKLTLQKEQSIIFEDIFKEQEKIPKKSDGSEILGKDGKPIKQEGGTYSKDVLEFAKKYNLSPERISELMQEGGVQTQQEEGTEGQASNPQEEQSELTPEKIIQAYAQATQQDPQAILSQLQALSPQEQQKALEQMLASLQQGKQSGQEEGAEGAMSNPQEDAREMMQEGGEKTVNVNSTKSDSYSRTPSNVSRLPYTPPNETGNDMWMGFNYETVWKPLVEKTMSDPKKAKEIESWLVANSGKYSSNIQAQLEGLTGKDRTDRITKLATDHYPGLFHNAFLDAVKKTDNLPKDAPSDAPTDTQGKVIDRNITKNVLPEVFTPFRTPPSAVINPYLQQVALSRAEAQKGSIENSLASNANAEQTAYAQTADLPPALRASTLANFLGQTQQANNNAIATQEVTDRQDNTRVQMYNNAQSDKEQILNENLKKQYEREALTTMNNSENGWNRYFNAIEGDRRQNFEDVRDLNTTNAAFNNYQTNGSTIDFVNPTKFTNPINDNKALYEWYAKASPEQKAQFQKDFINSKK